MTATCIIESGHNWKHSRNLSTMSNDSLELQCTIIPSIIILPWCFGRTRLVFHSANDFHDTYCQKTDIFNNARVCFFKDKIIVVVTDIQSFGSSFLIFALKIATFMVNQSQNKSCSYLFTQEGIVQYFTNFCCILLSMSLGMHK